MRRAEGRRHVALGSLNLTIAGKQRPGCVFGLEGLLGRGVPGRAQSLEPFLLPPLLSLSCALSSQVDGRYY